ncbi:MAG: GAF domain-containing protein [Ottowia sp.]|nr:GAF domain-containing protein [Ottowia sp.]
MAVSPACDGEGFARAMALAHLDALRDLGQPAYEMFARVAAQVCGAPMAAITLLDDTTQWIQGSVGVPFKYTPIELSFCRHALGSGGALTVIADTRDDARVALHPLVTGAPGVRFYAGAPLVQPNGQVIGTVCVTDVRPRQLTPAQAQSLRWLAGAAMRMLQLRAPTAAESHLLAPRLAA